MQLTLGWGGRYEQEGQEGARGHPEEGEDSQDQEAEESGEEEVMAGTRPPVLQTSTIKKETGCGSMYVTITPKESKYKEVFAILGKSGGCVTGHLASLTRMVTLARNAGISAEKIVKQLCGIRCPKDSSFLPSCSEALAQVIKEEWGEEAKAA